MRRLREITMENRQPTDANNPDNLFIRYTAVFPRHRASFGVWLLCGLILAFCLPAPGQQRQAAAPPQDFNQIAAQAAAARDADRLDEAIALYRKALNLRPKWDEGWWFLATLLYDRDNYTEAVRAFKEVTNLAPKSGAAWAMLGLCEYQLGRYDDALAHIQQGSRLGLGDNLELIRVMRYHEGVLQLLKGEFETAQQILGTLSYEGIKTEDLVIALGLSILRIPVLPKQVDVNYRDRELIRRAGWAEHQNAQKNVGDAQREYERLAADFSKAPGVQYAYGRYLLATRNDEAALTAFQREIENSPNHALARLQIAYIKLKNKDVAAGLPFAEAAVKLHPRLPLGHYILGRLLFDTGQNDRAIEELEIARRLVPTEPKVYFALSRAYARANRKAEAEQARDAFARLSRLAEEAAGQGVTRGEAIQEDAVGSKPTPP